MNPTDPPTADAQVAALVAEYARLIRRAVRRVGGSRAALMEDDVQQDVMLAVWQQLQRGQTIERPASYIYRAAIRAAVRLVKRDAARMSVAFDDAPQAVEAASTSDPHRRLEDKEQQQVLLECLDTLEENRRLAVRAHLSGFEVQEIMEMFDWPYQRARHLVARGMADLRRALRARGVHD